MLPEGTDQMSTLFPTSGNEWNIQSISPTARQVMWMLFPAFTSKHIAFKWKPCRGSVSITAFSSPLWSHPINLWTWLQRVELYTALSQKSGKCANEVALHPPCLFSLLSYYIHTLYFFFFSPYLAACYNNIISMKHTQGPSHRDYHFNHTHLSVVIILSLFPSWINLWWFKKHVGVLPNHLLLTLMSVLQYSFT